MCNDVDESLELDSSHQRLLGRDDFISRGEPSVEMKIFIVIPKTVKLLNHLDLALKIVHHHHQHLSL